MAGILTKGVKLSYCATQSGTYTDLTNLQEYPDIGGTADSVEVTTLDDAAHMFINGLLSYGDSLDFVFLYDKTQFGSLKGLSGSYYWKLGIPDGASGAISTTASFSGESSVKIDSKGTNEAMTYTLSIKPNSAIAFS